MQTLLIVLVIGCAGAFAAHIGRGMWARTRSVERHQQALDTLASLTNQEDGPQGAHADGGDHQAHVRVIGPTGHVRSASNGPVTTHRAGPVSAAALPPSWRSTRPLAAPPSGREPETRPVPVVQPQVFYFDDAAAPQPGRVPPATAEASPPTVAMAALTPPPPPPAAPSTPARPAVAMGPDRLGSAPVRSPRRPMVWVLAIAAVSVAIAGVAVALELDNPGHGANVATRGEHSGRPAPLHPRPAPPTTTPASVTTTTSAPTQPAVLLSANKGTATYQLTSPGASIEVTTTGPCWIEVKVGGAGGRTIFEGTLAAGGHSKVTGPAWIRLGDPPYAKVTVDGTPMTVPGATTAVPLNLQFTLG